LIECLILVTKQLHMRSKDRTEGQLYFVNGAESVCFIHHAN